MKVEARTEEKQRVERQGKPIRVGSEAVTESEFCQLN